MNAAFCDPYKMCEECVGCAGKSCFGADNKWCPQNKAETSEKPLVKFKNGTKAEGETLFESDEDPN
jgi:hypothetical protein